MNLSVSITPFLVQKQVTNLDPFQAYLEQNSRDSSSKTRLLQNAAGLGPGRGDVTGSGGMILSA